MTREIIQHLVDDSLYAIIFTLPKATHEYVCAVFLSIPFPAQYTPCKCELMNLTMTLNEVMVVYDNTTKIEEDDTDNLQDDHMQTIPGLPP